MTKPNYMVDKAANQDDHRQRQADSQFLSDESDSAALCFRSHQDALNFGRYCAEQGNRRLAANCLINAAQRYRNGEVEIVVSFATGADLQKQDFDMIADSDVETVARFMQTNIAAARLVPVAEAIASLAPVLWGHYGRDELVPLSLAHSGFEPKAAIGSELGHSGAGDGSAAVVGRPAARYRGCAGKSEAAS